MHISLHASVLDQYSLVLMFCSPCAARDLGNVNLTGFSGPPHTGTSIDLYYVEFELASTERHYARLQIGNVFAGRHDLVLQHD